MKRGREVIQQFGPSGYTVPERITNLPRGLPPLIHAMGQKPWYYTEVPNPFKDPRRYYDTVHAELSPYTYIARQYRRNLNETADWMNIRTLPGKLLNAVALGNPSLAEIPLTLFDSFARRLKLIFRISRYRVVPPK